LAELEVALSIFFGLLSIASGIFVVAWEQRKSRLAYSQTQDRLNKILSYFQESAKSGIEEKIAMLNKYRDSVNNWNKNDVDKKLDPITSDIRAINYIKSIMDVGQKERFQKAIRELKEEMSKCGFNSGRIDDVANCS
jgi:exoribonuclease II